MNSNYGYCLIGSRSDVGMVRKANEDSMGVFETINGLIVVVCDGMGGHVGGRTASETAVETIKCFLENNLFEDPRVALRESIIAANNAILNKAEKQPELTGMGSTCVILLIRNGNVYHAHVGDSRIYFVANHFIKQLTRDDSFVQMLVDTNKISAEEAEQHPCKNEITNALGLPDMKPPTVSEESIKPEAGNCFLLCSDGLTGMVANKYIERIVSNHNLNIQNRADELVKMANNAGGEDNITVLLVEFAINVADSEHNELNNLTKEKKQKKFILLLLGVIIVLAIAIFSGNLFRNVSNEKEVETLTKIKTSSNSAITQSEKRDTTITLEGSIEFKKNSTQQIIDVILPKPLQISIDKQYTDFAEIDKADKNFIIIHWKNKDFTDNQLKILLETETNIYHIIIHVKLPSQSNPMPSAKDKTQNGLNKNGEKNITNKSTEKDLPKDTGIDKPNNEKSKEQ